MLVVNKDVSVNNFELKNTCTDLVEVGYSFMSGREFSLKEMEAVRTAGARLSASKFGLEAICGASCDTGAQ